MNKVSIIAMIAIVAVSLSGCSSQEALKQEGSSTVLPLAEIWAEDFFDVTGGVVEVAGGGSGHGASGLCDGTLDLGDMSRDFKGYEDWKAGGAATEEVKTCLDNGITPIQWKVAFDGLSVVVDKSNDFVEDLSTEQLADVFGKGGATKWSDVDDSFPNTDIKRCIPDNESGTYEYFFEAILEETIGEDAEFADAVQSANDNVLVDCLKGDSNAVGFFGYAYVVANPNAVDAIKVNGVAPSGSTIEDGSYAPLSRALYIMTADPPEGLVFEYMHYILTDGQELVSQTGYVPLSDSVQREMLEQLGVI